MARNLKIPGTIQDLLKRDGQTQLTDLGKRINQLSSIQVTLMPVGDTRGGRAPIQFSESNAILPIPLDPRVSQIIASFRSATFKGVCNGDGTITCTLTLPGFPSQ